MKIPFALVVLCLFCACAADEITGVGQTSVDAQTQVHDLGMTSLRDAGQSQEQLRVRLELMPVQATYAVGAEIEVNAFVVVGGTETPTTEWTVQPDDFAQRTSDRALILTTPGTGRVELCVGQTCASQSLFVVDTPTIQVNYPARGQMVELDDAQFVTVAGRLENFAGGFPTVLVNGQAAELGDDFTFSAEVPVELGVNQLNILVQEPTLDVQPTYTSHFLAANGFYPFESDRLRIEDAITLIIDDSLLDGCHLDDNLSPVATIVNETATELAHCRPPILPDLENSADSQSERSEQDKFCLPVTLAPGETVEVHDVMQFLTIVMQTIDPIRWLPSPLSSLNELMLSVSEIDLGTLGGQIRIGNESASANLSIYCVSVHTRGSFLSGSSALSLDGKVSVDLSTFAVFDADIDDTILVDLVEVDAMLERITGNYANSTVNGLLQALDSELTSQFIEILTDFVQTLFREQAIPLLQFAFNQLLSQIEILPIIVPSPIEGIPDISLTAEAIPTNIEIRSGEARLNIAVDIRSNSERIEHQNDLGAPRLQTEDAQQNDAPVTLGVKLDVLNALCHSMWKTGFLNAEPALPDAATLLLDSAKIDAKLPPVIALSAGQTEVVSLELSELHLTLTPKNDQAPELYIINLSVPVTLNAQEGFIKISIDGDPNFEVDTLIKNENSPINAALVSTLLSTGVWPPIQEAIGEGLTYGINDIPVERSLLSEITPLLSGLRIKPRILNDFFQHPGHITVGAQLSAEATRRAETPNNIE